MATIFNEDNIIMQQHALAVSIASGVTNDDRIQANTVTEILGGNKNYIIDVNGDGIINFSVGDKVMKSQITSGVLTEIFKRTEKKISVNTIVARKLTSSEKIKKIFDDKVSVLTNYKSMATSIRKLILVAKKYLANVNFYVKNNLNINRKINSQDNNPRDNNDSILIAPHPYFMADAISNDNGGKIIVCEQSTQAYASISAQDDLINDNRITPHPYLMADAISNDNGSKIIVCEQSTQAHGSISAQDDLINDNSVFIETFNHALEIKNKVSTFANHRTSDIWLLDQDNVVINDLDIASKFHTCSANFNAGNNLSILCSKNFVAVLAANSKIIVTTNTNTGCSGGTTINKILSFQASVSCMSAAEKGDTREGRGALNGFFAILG